MRFYDDHENVIDIPIETQDETTLLEWSETLNTWVWPETMPGKPADYDHLPYYSENKGKRTKYSIQKNILNTLISIVGVKKTLWYHNVVADKSMSEDEFQDWWIENINNGNLNCWFYIEVPKKHICKHDYKYLWLTDDLEGFRCQKCGDETLEID